MKIHFDHIELPLEGMTLKVDATVELGRLGIRGVSGSGKTSLLELIAGFRRPSQGRIVVDDQVWVDGSSNRFLPPQRRGIGYAPQDLAFFPHLTAEENIAYGMDPAMGLDLYPELIERFELGLLLHRKMTELSGGEKQRIILARALLRRDVTLYLLDEPVSSINPELRTDVHHFLNDWFDRKGCGLIYVSHSQEELNQVCTSTAVMSQGVLRFDD